MAEDHETNTEAPTEKRLQEAWSEGRFAKAPDLQMVAVLTAALVAINSGSREMGQKLAGLSVGIFSHLNRFTLAPESIGEWARLSATTMLGLIMPIAGVCLVASIVAGGLQTRFQLTPKVLTFKFSRMDPMQGFGRIFSQQGLVKMSFELAKLGLVAWVVWGCAKTIMLDPIFAVPVSAVRLADFLQSTLSTVLGRCLMALGVVGAGSYLHQFRKTSGELKMSKQEVKDEHKQMEGDPKVKGMLRSMAKRLMRKQMLAKVATADVVITNPTHFAVALKYERGKDKAPVILAKGEDAFARRIKALAAEHEVPMVENKPVARMLYKHGKVGSAIPMELYQVVADILAFVYKTHKYYFHQLPQRRAVAEAEA